MLKLKTHVILINKFLKQKETVQCGDDMSIRSGEWPIRTRKSAITVHKMYDFKPSAGNGITNYYKTRSFTADAIDKTSHSANLVYFTWVLASLIRSQGFCNIRQWLNFFVNNVFNEIPVANTSGLKSVSKKDQFSSQGKQRLRLSDV